LTVMPLLISVGGLSWVLSFFYHSWFFPPLNITPSHVCVYFDHVWYIHPCLDMTKNYVSMSDDYNRMSLSIFHIVPLSRIALVHAYQMHIYLVGLTTWSGYNNMSLCLIKNTLVIWL
jgi:hypothetical protein